MSVDRAASARWSPISTFAPAPRGTDLRRAGRGDPAALGGRRRGRPDEPRALYADARHPCRPRGVHRPGFREIPARRRGRAIWAGRRPGQFVEALWRDFVGKTAVRLPMQGPACARARRPALPTPRAATSSARRSRSGKWRRRPRRRFPRPKAGAFAASCGLRRQLRPRAGRSGWTAPPTRRRPGGASARPAGGGWRARWRDAADLLAATAGADRLGGRGYDTLQGKPKGEGEDLSATRRHAGVHTTGWNLVGTGSAVGGERAEGGRPRKKAGEEREVNTSHNDRDTSTGGWATTAWTAARATTASPAAAATTRCSAAPTTTRSTAARATIS